MAAATLPIYLIECDVWSDGESDHEEDHNIYYDMQYFYIVNEPDYKVSFGWFCYHSTFESGMVTETRLRQHLDERKKEKVVGAISMTDVRRLLKGDLAKLEAEIKRAEKCIYRHYEATGDLKRNCWQGPGAWNGSPSGITPPAHASVPEDNVAKPKRLYDAITAFLKTTDEINITNE